MSYDWYPWHIQKYRRATTHLGLAEDGAYRRLIDEYMMTRAPLPDNDAALARIVGVSKEEWCAVAAAVRPFFEASNGKLINETCEEELNAQACQAHATSTKNRAAANSRWAKAREIKDIHARASQPHTPRMPNDATLHYNTSSSSLVSPEEKTVKQAGSLASGPLDGPLTRPPCAETAVKRPSEVTRAELDAILAAKRKNISRETPKAN